MRQPLVLALAATAMALASAYQGAAVHASAWLWRLGCAVAVTALWPVRSQAAPRRARACVVAVGVATVLGWSRAQHLFAGLDAAASALFACALLVTLVPQSVRVQRLVLTGLSALAAAHAAAACLQRAYGQTSRAGGGFYNPNDLAAFAAPAAAFFLLQAADARSQIARWRHAALALVCAAGIAAAQSRSGALALLLSAACAALHTLFEQGPTRNRTGAAPGAGGRRRTRAPAWSALAAAVVLAGATLGQRVHDDAADPYAYGRTAIWRSALAALRAQPLGYGYGNVAAALRARGVAVAGPVRHPAYANHAHSEWLQAGLEAGWPGLLATLGPALWLTAAQLRRRQRFAVLCGLCSVWVPASVGASLHQPPVAAMAMAWAAYAWPRPTARAVGYRRAVAPGARPSPALGAAIAAALLATLPAAMGQGASARAERALRRGDLPRAMAWAQRACLAAPWDLGHLLHRADLAALALPGPSAEGPYAALAEQYPDRWEPWQRIAQRRSQGARGGAEHRAASHAWREAARRHPHGALLWANAALHAGRAGAVEAMAEAAAQAVADEPHCAAALLAQAWHADWTGQTDARRRLARRALAAHARREAYTGYARAVLSLPEPEAPLVRAWAEEEASP